jgi:hypothetical protein
MANVTTNKIEWSLTSPSPIAEHTDVRYDYKKMLLGFCLPCVNPLRSKSVAMLQ